MRKIKIILSIVLSMILIFATGCKNNEDNINIETNNSKEILYPNIPQTKSDGTKYRIAYVDYDDYLPARQQLYYILEGLKKTGWIECEEYPFNPNDYTSKEMIQIVSNMDLGEYIEFDESACYYLEYDGKDKVAKNLKKHTEINKDIDLVLTFGTSAGVFVKELDLSVPMVDFSATDPVASGIIESSTNGSGNDNIWAQVELSMPLRQMKYYHNLIPFNKLGIVVYGNETISGVPDIEKSAEEIGFELIKINMEETNRLTKKELNAYYKEVENNFQKLINQKIDAFFLTVDLINDLDMLSELLDIFYENKIPVFIMDNTETIENGGFLIISTYDFENVGYFIADAIGKIFSGTVAGDLPCIYTSSPYICFNYDVAKKIDFIPDFKFLISCDEIYTTENQNVTKED